MGHWSGNLAAGGSNQERILREPTTDPRACHADRRWIRGTGRLRNEPATPATGTVGPTNSRAIERCRVHRRSWFPPLRESDTGNHWEEVTINGYPAVIVDVGANIPSRRDDSTLVHIKADTWGKLEADPCGAVKKVAEFVIDDLRPQCRDGRIGSDPSGKAPDSGASEAKEALR
ncbi:hypothetical protein ACIQUM_09550 [Amycolatopsis azurea]|uniref:hypothetical protein n=1 Tax=Amycolatopsis azurea TaxID=36819 RepID=UPI0038140770